MRTLRAYIMLACIAATCIAETCSVTLTGAAQQAPTPANAPKEGKTPEAQQEAQGNPTPPKSKDAAQPPIDENNPLPKAKPSPRKLPKPDTLYVEAGYADWGLSGNQTKFRQYATPPTGWFLRDLRYAPMFRSPAQNAFFELKGIGQDDYRAATRLAGDYGATQVSGFLSASRFFDPTAGPINPSSWRSDGFNVRRALTREFALSFQYRRQSQQLNYAVPYPNLDQNTDYWDGVAAGKVGHGFVRFDFSNFHYADSTGSLLNFDAQTTGLRYQYDLTPAVALEAAATHTNIRQPILPESQLDTYSLSGDFRLGPSTDLSTQFEHRQLGLPTVQNAYARNQNTGTFQLNQRWNSWRAQVGLRLQNDDRVNGDQTYVDVPKWSTLEGRVSGRLSRDLRLTVRAHTQSLSDPPSSVLSDPRTLYWTNRNYLQARLEGGSPDLNAYLVYTYQANRNSQRDTDVTTNQYTLGTMWQATRAVNVFAEYHHENWTGRTDDAAYAFNDFLPDSDTGIVEVSWNLPNRIFLSASYTGFATYNANPLLLQDGNTRASFVTINGRYRFPAGYEVGLMIAPWSYTDTVVNTLNYHAAVLMVTGAVRF